MKNTTIRTNAPLPSHVLNLFWEYRKSALSWHTDSDLIIRKVLESGGWDSVKWLLVTAGRAWLKDWIIQHQGGGLDPKRLRFWQEVLGVPQQLVDRWIVAARTNPWEERRHR